MCNNENLEDFLESNDCQCKTHIPHPPLKQSALSHSLHSSHPLNPTELQHYSLFLWLDLYIRQFPKYKLKNHLNEIREKNKRFL